MCELQNNERKWMQSDTCAVTCELITGEMLFKRNSLGADDIQYYEVRCRLKLKSCVIDLTLKSPTPMCCLCRRVEIRCWFSEFRRFCKLMIRFI